MSSKPSSTPSKEAAALAKVDAEFRSLVRQASEPDATGLPMSSRAFVDAVRELEEMIASRSAGVESAPTLEQLRRDVERKKALLEKHKGDLARWKTELEVAVAEAESVLQGVKQ